MKHLVFLILCIGCCACTRPGYRGVEVHAPSSDNATVDKQAVAGNFSPQKQLFFDSAALSVFLDRYPHLQPFDSAMRQFYRGRSYAYAWYDQNGLIEQAGSLMNRIVNLPADGITGKLTYEDAFVAMMNDNDSTLRTLPMNPDAELMLTAQYFNFAHHVWQGVGQTDENKMDWFIVRKQLNLEALLDSLLVPAAHAAFREPVYRQYALLRTALQQYSAIDAAGGWPSITPEKKMLNPGDSAAMTLQLRKRLLISGHYEGDTSDVVYTPDLVDAVKRFQETRGLTPDGVVGPSVVAALNVPASQIVKKIILNMERARWVPVRMDGEYIVVNIPAFKLYVYDHDSLVWDMNIVAGQPIHETVTFNGELKYIVFSPYWNVPQSIYRNEIVPGIQKDPEYLAKHNMEPHGSTVRQKPGPNNSLGRVKFLFPNSYNIYLHDTPARSLFSKDVRAFSHGCIRLAEPKRLAEYLLRSDTLWTPDKITKAMNSTTEKWVTLRKPVPVFIAYFTAWVDRSGRLNVRNDVYKRDDRLAEMLIAGN